MGQNFSLIYETSFKHDSFLELQKFCNDLITDEPEKIFKSLQFQKNLWLLSFRMIIFKRMKFKYGNMCLSAQNPELLPDPASFSKEDFSTLKKTLERCIP